MPVLRSQRTYPLAFTGASINTGIVAAYDWAGDPANSRAGGNGADHSGNARNWTAPSAAAAVVANIGGVTGLDGLDLSVGRTNAANFFSKADLAELGLNFGSGAYTIWMRIRAPSVAPSSIRVIEVARNKSSSGATLLQHQWYEVTSTGKYHPRIVVAGATAVLEWSTAGNSGVSAGQIVDIYVTRSAAGVLKAFVNGSKLATGTESGNWSGGGAGASDNYRGTVGIAHDTVFVDEVSWSRELSEAEVVEHAANPYAYYTNTAPADSISLTVPSVGASLGTSFAVSGTYVGTPTAIEASFNGSAYQTIAASPTGGTFSGTFSGATPASGTLTVRFANATGVMASAAVTVIAASITIAPPAVAASGADTYARAYRIFQRDGSNQASVRIAGTYTGAATNIEYRFNGGAWSTLVSGATGGAFDATVTLTGPAQGALDVRFSNNIGVTSSLAAVGVGDVYIVGGQSPHVGMANTVQIPPVAPVGNPDWVASEFSKANSWRANVETLAQPFDDRTGAVESTTYTAGTVYGSYFGALATLVMAAGVPVAFVPCALGSTGIDAWQPGLGATSLYAVMLKRATIVNGHKAVLWWQGEGDTATGSSMAQATYETRLNTLINSWWGSTGKPFVLININDQGLTGVAAVRTAIANVAASNTHVLAIADALGAWADGNVHYNTTGGINTVALRVSAAIGYTATRTVTLTLTTDGAAPAASLSGLKWAFFNESTPDAFLAPAAKGVSESTNSTGSLVVDVSGTSLTTGQTGWLIVTDSDGTTTQSPAAKAFSGPVVVA